MAKALQFDQSVHNVLGEALLLEMLFSNSTTTNKSGHNYPITVIGNLAYTEGITGQAFSFDGSTRIKIDIELL